MSRAEPVRITVIKPGWLTTVQDLGRYGYQKYGVPVSGAMDRRSFIIANRLVGNCDNDAGLEITISGPELLFEQDAIIAVTGADLSPSVNGIGIPLWTSVRIERGNRFSFGAAAPGLAATSPSRAGSMCRSCWEAGLPTPTAAPVAWRVEH
jgi:Allophanate hydrolase subunit 2